MRTGFACFALFGAVAAFAQDRPANTIRVVPAEGSRCPIVLGAQRWAAGALEQAAQEAPGGQVHGLYLHPVTTNRIVGLSVLVRGSSLGAHIQPVSPRGPSERSEAFHLAESERDRDGSWKLTVTEVPLVREVEISEITFADGTTWRKSAEARCVVQPSPLVLVASTR